MVDNISIIAETVLCEIEVLRQKKEHILIAIDGRCAAGKTTLAAYLQGVCGCNVIHMDYFFLRPEQRTEERLLEAGSNVDYERFFTEVMVPLRQKELFSFRPFDCHNQVMKEAIQIQPKPVNIIEGAYSCHPTLIENYDLKIFMTVDEEEQMRRIKKRNGEAGAVQFKEKWIPMEERYFSTYKVKERCNLYFQSK